MGHEKEPNNIEEIWIRLSLEKSPHPSPPDKRHSSFHALYPFSMLQDWIHLYNHHCRVKMLYQKSGLLISCSGSSFVATSIPHPHLESRGKGKLSLCVQTIYSALATSLLTNPDPLCTHSDFYREGMERGSSVLCTSLCGVCFCKMWHSSAVTVFLNSPDTESERVVPVSLIWRLRGSN